MGSGKRLAAGLTSFACVCALALPAAAAAQEADPLSEVGHVFTIVLENKDYDVTFGPNPKAPYLAEKLAAKGQVLTQYHGTGHFSLGNYITLISGQAETPLTQADCQSFDEMTPGTPGLDGQILGSGCVYPATARTVADQMEAAGLGWRAYMEDMGKDLERDTTRRCAHPPIGAEDVTQKATENDQYATRHNPFVYFHSIIDDFASCKRHVVNLRRLRHDLQHRSTTREYSFITPDLCSDGHDEKCENPKQQGGYEGIDAFLRRWVPKILHSKAFKQDGLLVITFDESEEGAESCCFVPTGPNTPLQGIYGPGGGRTGTVLISPLIEPGTVNDAPYNHYDLLRTVEQAFGLGYLGYAARPEVKSFGADVFGG
jgi:hypothetical protein